MTVLPVRSTRIAPAGGTSSPFFPTRVKVPFSTRNAESGIGALPSPTISCAPSNKTALPVAAGGWFAGGDEQAASRRSAAVAHVFLTAVALAKAVRPARTGWARQD